MLRCLWLGAIASTTGGARDDAQPEPDARAAGRRGRGFRPARRYTARREFGSALTAPMYGRPGASPVFLVSGHRRVGGPLADAEQVRGGGTPSGPLMQAPRSARCCVALRSRRDGPRVRRSAWRRNSGQRTRGGPEGPPATNRSGPRSALEIRSAGYVPASVHIPSTSFASAGFRPPRPYTPHCS